MADASSVLAVVPTYYPPETLRELVRSLSDQVVEVVVSDDSSPCTYDTLLCSLASIPHVRTIRHTRNRGIARGLNDGLARAREINASWLLTVDQDSIITSDHVARLLDNVAAWEDAAEPLGAVGVEIVADSSGELVIPTSSQSHGSLLTTHELIQTGTLWNVSALTAANSFDERLAIDAVDAAACLRLREKGYGVAVSPGLSIGHSLGSSRTITLAGRQIMITGHSPQRRASMLRNRLTLFPAEFRQSPRHALRTIRRVITNQSLGLLLENDRWAKAKGSIAGLRTGHDR